MADEMQKQSFNQHFMSAILGAIREGVVVVDGGSRIRLFNTAAERLFGLRASEIVGKDMSCLMPASDGALHMGHLEKMLRTGCSPIIGVDRVVTGLRGDGQEFPMVIRVGMMTHEDETMFVAAVRAVQVAEDASTVGADDFKTQELSLLLPSAAHELNGPLTAILGYAWLLQQADLGENEKKSVKAIHQGAERCKRLVQGILMLSRRRRLKREEVDLNEVVESALELDSCNLDADNIAIVKYLSAPSPQLFADFHQLRQVFLNIVINARQAMAEHFRGGTLTVRTQLVERMVVVEIEDTGPGICAEQAEEIFKPYVSTKGGGQGSGLGLPICKGIVSEHGGSIDVQSGGRRGSLFRVLLPVCEQAVQEAGRGDCEPDDAEESPAACVLVVDDEEMIADLVGEILRRDGHQVDIARDGAEALERLMATEYDLIISDIRMPGLSGDVLYREAVARKPNLATRFVFCTGDTMAERTREFIEGSGCRYLPKPFSIEEFHKMVIELLGENGPGSGERVRDLVSVGGE